MNRFTYIFFILFSLILFSRENYSSDIPASSKGELTFYVDNASFKTDDKNLFVEFYLMLFADQLKLQEKNGKKFAVFNVTAELKKENEKSESNIHTWETEAYIEDSKDVKELAVYDYWNESLEPGNYSVKVKVSDKNSARTGTADFSLTITEIQEDIFSGSSIQFISSVAPSKKGNLIKLDQSVIPNPSRRYGILNPVLYFYYELYNLPDNEFIIQYSINDQENKLIKTFPEKNFKSPADNISFIHGLNIGTVKAGIYNLNAEISSIASSQKIILTRQLEILQADSFVPKNLLTEEESEEAGKLIKYIATPEQNDFYESLNLPGKTEFIIKFWKNLDPTPGTLENEYLKKIRERFNYANKNFSWAGIEGWKTERGRILILYGMPDEIERHHYESGSLPYEIWSYSTEREYLFVFGDLRSDGRFTLLHSNKDGEIFNERWMEFLTRM